MRQRLQRLPSVRQASPRHGWRLNVVQLVRAMPIRWRILAIAGVNAAVLLILAALIWDGARTLTGAWDDVRRVHESDRLFAVLEGEAGRLQNLIHRYINQPSPQIFAEILLLREAVLGTLSKREMADPSGSIDDLEKATERFLDGFGDLRAEQAAIAKTYEEQVLAPAREMSGLYAIIDGAISNRDALIWPALGKSREAFTATVVAANAYYFSFASKAAQEARKSIAMIEQTIPVMIDLAENDLQRSALLKLGERAGFLRKAIGELSEHFERRDTLLRSSIDANQAAMIAAIDTLSSQLRQREQQAQTRFDETLRDIYRKIAVVGLVFLAVVLVAGVLIALSIRLPLQELKAAMEAIMLGRYDQEIRGTNARDEIGEMARAVAVFRENAIAKRAAEDQLRASKEQAEQALADLRNAQQSLVDAERLAALGGLVAGIAHEVNNPIGISLTVASSLAYRCDAFAGELRGDAPLRRSRLSEFVSRNGDAARQLVANLQRAAELIQSFKQVAVDRSHAERREFDLQEATDQIVASLRPALKKSRINLTVSVPKGIVLDSYPGSYGQVLTNLFLNAVHHAFPADREGTILIEARPLHDGEVEVSIVDDGLGMSADVKRQAFDPFFTTRRSAGGTGLGLHIVYNLVTQQLGGKLTLESKAGQGTTLRMTLPRSAPRETPLAFADINGSHQWQKATTSSA
jgi:signal transduction histidine kinase